MAVKLLRCGNPWPVRCSKHDAMEAHTGQRLRTGQRGYPAIEFDDGTWCREQSADMAKTIRAGRLMEKSG